MRIVGIILFALGAFITLLNLYLSFIRYPIHLARGGTREMHRWVSGFPRVGSMLLWISMGLLPTAALKWTAGILSIFDTGGLHWFVGTIAWTGLLKALFRGNKHGA